jgi:hypothetical protein
LNLYAFVNNDPVNGADAFGLWNVYNPATWGVANAAGWSLGDSLNPLHESASWDAYSADYLRQSLASATGWGVFGEYDRCDRNLTRWQGLGRGSLLALEIFGPMKLGSWAAAGSGLLRSGTALALDSYGLYQSAAAIGTGAGRVGAGDYWGAVDLGLGAMGVKLGMAGVLRSGSSFVSGVRAWNAAETALPELRISASKYPDLAENMLHAQRAGHPNVLTHGGDAVINANRNAALHEPYKDFVPKIKGFTRDEYPFASSLEGGPGAWVGHVPVSQHNAQGALIKNFIDANKITPGMQYRVVIVP